MFRVSLEFLGVVTNIFLPSLPPLTNLYLAAQRCSLPPPPTCVAPSLQGNMGVADVDSSEPQKGELKMSSGTDFGPP